MLVKSKIVMDILYTAVQHSPYTTLHLPGPADFLPQAAVLDILVSKGANPNARTQTGTTLAHIAARDGKSSCLKVLCDTDADIDAVNQFGNTPVMLAVMANDVKVTIILREARRRHLF